MVRGRAWHLLCAGKAEVAGKGGVAVEKASVNSCVSNSKLLAEKLCNDLFLLLQGRLYFFHLFPFHKFQSSL